MRLALKRSAMALGLMSILAGTPVLAASSAPAAQHETRAEHEVRAKGSAKASQDEAAYAAREAKNPELARYQAGDAIVIGSSVVAAVLIIVALALLL